MTSTKTEPAIVSEVTIDAPIARVFRALTDPNELTQWWGEEGLYHTEHMEVDLRVGGRWKTTGKGSDGEPFTVEGVYLTVDPPHALEFTWTYDWDEKASETVVRYDLSESNGATHLRVTHSGFTDAVARNNHEMGWTKVLNWLSAYVA